MKEENTNPEKPQDAPNGQELESRFHRRGRRRGHHHQQDQGQAPHNWHDEHDWHAEHGGHGGHGGHGVQGERNFWREWRRARFHPGDPNQVGQALSPKEMEAWREFFHQSFGTWPENHWIFGGRRFSPWHQGMDTFNPFVATLLSKGGGLLPLYVLHLIAQQPRYGNEIMDLLAERTNGQWVSNPGAIYPLLTLLEREGFIDGKWEDPEKRTVRVYTITEAGQAEVVRIKMIVTPKLEETLQVLQEFLKDLYSQPDDGEPETGSDSGSQNDLEED